MFELILFDQYIIEQAMTKNRPQKKAKGGFLERRNQII